jgi:hypothetical protein
VLFTKRFWPGIADGSVTMTFRRWKRRQVIAGRRYRTPAGMIEVESVDIVAERDVTQAHARRAGFATADELVADLRGTPDLPLYRIVFHLVDEPDARDLLAHDADLSADGVAAIARRLDRMDRAAAGPWTRDVLEAIEARPGVRAPDLAASFGRETTPFKRDVRKLKNLGLTISLRVGYRLSPRGVAYLSALRDDGG